jgi:hypothetical protein
MKNWKYFGRTAGGPSIFKICRFPDIGGDLDDQDWSRYPEWLQPDGTWKFYPDDRTISNERLTGDFDEHIDEISKEQVDELYDLWSSGEWPAVR